jgi:hypothetical protein
VFCLLIPSCTKHQQSQQKNNVDQALADNQKKIVDIIVQQEAMLVDIAIPLYDERIIPLNNFSIESDTLVFGYKSPLACAQAQAFFMNQMERYGWQHLVSFTSEDILLQFQSPDRYCSIIIKKDVSRSDGSSIFIYIKKASTQDNDEFKTSEH